MNRYVPQLEAYPHSVVQSSRQKQATSQGISPSSLAERKMGNENTNENLT